MALLLMGATAWGQKSGKQAIHPDQAAYKIDGNFSYDIVDNRVLYKLTDVRGTGLTVQVKDESTLEYRDVQKGDIFHGDQKNMKEVEFTFEKIILSDGFPGFNDITYWYYDPSIEDWQKDSEIRKSEEVQQNSKDLTVMLIIDCSNSLENDLEKVKDATLGFLKQIYESNSEGNVHVGLIAFSSIPDTKIEKIRPLTKENYNELRTQIKGLSASNGTALFYSWDLAIQETENYILHGNEYGSMHNYEKSYFITFTDGIDQTSQNINHIPPIVSSDDYYEYVVTTAKKRILNYESDVVFVKGKDITNELQQKKFENKLMQLAVPSDDMHYERLESIDNLKRKFSEIADRLIDSWKELKCYVAPARHGKVCWTFGMENAPKPKPTPRSNPKEKFFGLGAYLGVGLPAGNMYAKGTIMGNARFGMDWAWSTSDKFAIGFYLSLGGGYGKAARWKHNYTHNGYGYESYYYLSENPSFNVNLNVGLLMLFGNLHKNPFMVGISPLTGIAYYNELGPMSSGIELRMGCLLGKRFYLTGYCKYNGLIEPGINLGVKL